MSNAGAGPGSLRQTPFARCSPSPSPGPSQSFGRPQSATLRSPPSSQPSPGHTRNQSFSPSNTYSANSIQFARPRSHSNRGQHQSSSTFAPQFIKSEVSQRPDESVRGLEGENDLSGNRYVWLRDPEKAFVKGLVVEDSDNDGLLVRCQDGSQRRVRTEDVDKVNPAKFDKANDMAELTHLNEASVVHNLCERYQSDLIYTYSGLFLVAVNPYFPLPIYTDDYVRMYKGQSREDIRPHIYAMADCAYRNMVEEGENQSILVTGESGAGKTENTKKVIQYLASVAKNDDGSPVGRQPHFSDLSEQILRANPILEAFGNAQTMRNNNSSRFGKFIRIELSRQGRIAGAHVDWYLLEKSRVVKLNPDERNYHIFYQLLYGAGDALKDQLQIAGLSACDFVYTQNGNQAISGVSDKKEWEALLEAFQIMGFNDQEQTAILRTIAVILILGNIKPVKASLRGDQATLPPESKRWAVKACHLLGIDYEDFIRGLLHPKVKAGREWVEKVQTPDQVRSSVDALAKGMYERMFGDLVARINRQLQRPDANLTEPCFIGVLDIAGFEIFENNSFEQLCINYTNEKLQQFFNHHMFVLEQEEYAREQIEWKFIDFGKDLQPTIDLIELPNPIGIFSCLDEDSVMPKATDRSFTEKLHSLWDRKTPKYRGSRLSQGFILTHYAAEVEYSTEGWLDKNKDPLSDSLTRLLASSEELYVTNLFQDCVGPDEDSLISKHRVRKGLFRTVAQRHKEQLSTLMSQLHSTHPHFVRCILPNHNKRPKQFQVPLVLDQLRCNGVLEGIRIARTGFPNRLPFSEFRQRYEVLCRSMPKGHAGAQMIVRIMLEKLELDRSIYRVGLTKVFFRAGVLADLEEQRDALIKTVVQNFQSVARGFVQRRIAAKRLYRAEATRILQHNFSAYVDLRKSPWWKLFVQMKPLLAATQTAAEVKRRDDAIQRLEMNVQKGLQDKSRIDDERRKAESELQRIQQTLESERSLAIDKEEIFKRLRDREAELEEKLTGAIEDQEKLEDQIDSLLEAKKNAQVQADAWRQKSEQASLIMRKLELEKNELDAEASDLRARISHVEKQKSERSEQENALTRDNRVLQSQLQLQQRKVADLESKLLKTDQDLEVKLAASLKDVASSHRKLGDLEEEKRNLAAQLRELSSTSTGYEDLLRRKESEIAILKADQRDFDAQRKSSESQKHTITTRFEELQTRMRNVQADADAIRSQKAQLEHENVETKKILEARLSQDLQADKSRKLLQNQVDDLKHEIFQTQGDLSRERQSRDDIQMLCQHQLSSLQDDHQGLNEAKITIEKELYVQQDTLRRALEARTSAERNRKDLQTELKRVRERYAEAESSRIEAQTVAERNFSKQANERNNALVKELENKDRYAEELTTERARLVDEVHGLKTLINDSDAFRLQNDQHKDRLEREIVTVKGRLTASENDNRALLNKIQQKNLDIARSSSRAGENQRSRLNQIQAENSKLQKDHKALQQNFTEAQMSIASLDKQKEKLSLDLEDLHHELEQGHKTSRNLEKTSASATAQLLEVNRNLDSERQLRTQAQTNTRKLQMMLDKANKEMQDSRQQLTLLHKVFYPEHADKAPSWETVARRLPHYTDLAGQLEACQQALRVTNEKCSNAESQIQQMRRRYDEELYESDTRHASSKRQMLEELNPNTLYSRQSPKQSRKPSDSKPRSNQTTPNQRHLSTISHDSNRSDRTVDTITYHKRMDIAAELEMLQNQLQLTELQNRHLHTQLGRISPQKDSWSDDSPSARRVQKLERENGRLNDRLDDSTKKLSTLERSVQSGDLSFREIQAKSHEELFELINSQEDVRRTLSHQFKSTVGELANAKSYNDNLKHAKATLDVELRDTKSELQEIAETRDSEAAIRAEMLHDFSDVQINLDAEKSRSGEMESSLQLYKRRADDYFNKLEQAEIAILKASRAEQNAKGQASESEERYVNILAERKNIESTVEELQRESQTYEARLEDVSADLHAAIQSKKRLQQELEDYRSQRAMDVEDKEISLEQTRRKYQNEFASLSNELEIERDNVLHARSETSRLRDELEDLRSKWDDEVLNSSAWSKEKSRLEMTLQDLASSRDEAVAAHQDAQGKVVTLLSQVRNLRTTIDDTANERDNLQSEKRGLESRLTEARDRLEELSRGDSPSMRNAAGQDREILDLKSQLAHQQDVSAAAVGKMRKVDALSTEMQKEICAVRESNDSLHKERAALEKSVKDLQGRVVELEAKGFPSASQDVRFLNGRIQELEHKLETQETTHASSLRSVRSVDRTVKDLQAQIERREKGAKQLSDDVNRGRDKIERLLQTIDELQAEEAKSQLAARRAERDFREEKEKSLRLERELQGWKALRVERGSSEWGGSMRGRHARTDSGDDGLNRMLSTTKGFL